MVSPENYTLFICHAWSQFLMSQILTDALHNVIGNIDRQHVRQPALAIPVETIEREDFDRLVTNLAPNSSTFPHLKIYSICICMASQLYYLHQTLL